MKQEKMVSFILLTIVKFNIAFYLLHQCVEGQGDAPKCLHKESKLVGDACFQFNDSPVTWLEAKINCEKKGMTLAYFSSINETKELLESYKFESLAWIGASDQANEGVFTWVESNESATELQQLWAKGEPNNLVRDTGDEDCVGIFPIIFYANDSPCARNYSYICMEKPCPYNLKIQQVFNDRVKISWKFRLNSFKSKTFNVKYQDMVTNISRGPNSVTFSKPNPNPTHFIEYSLSGLSAKTPYNLYLDVNSGKGVSECTPLVLTTKTTGPSDCPVNITVYEVGNDHAVLAWTPGRKDEFPQTFNIIAHNVTVLNDISVANVSVGSTQITNFSTVMHRVEKLSHSTNYTFSIEALNKFGVSKCKDNYIQVTTASGFQERSFPPWLIFVLIFIPLVLAAGTFGFLYYKKKAKRTSIIETPNTYDSLTNELNHYDGGHDPDLVYTDPVGNSAGPTPLENSDIYQNL